MASISDVCKGEIDLPVIDLSVLNPSDLQADKAMIMTTPLLELISKIGDACQETGFFHVINHGIEKRVIEGVDSAARDILFALPSEAKENLVSMNSWYDYLKRSEYSYLETINFKRVLLSDSTQRISDCLWPDGNPKFCKGVAEYSSKIDAFSKTLMKLIVLSLGFDMSSEYYESFFEKSCDSNLRCSSYVRPTILQSSAIPLSSHTDFSFISILYHDIIGGLQVQTKEGDWFRLKPVSNSTGTSFVVNLGDAFQIWSNGRYLSAPHRVIDEGWSSRLNVAFFVACKDETELYAPRELVDEDHPRRYVAFVFKDYKDYKYKLMFSRQKEEENKSTSPFLLPSPTPTTLLS
jgi:isopenicillin N synthase-like dioxygenase